MAKRKMSKSSSFTRAWQEFLKTEMERDSLGVELSLSVDFMQEYEIKIGDKFLITFEGELPRLFFRTKEGDILSHRSDGLVDVGKFIDLQAVERSLRIKVDHIYSPKGACELETYEYVVIDTDVDWNSELLKKNEKKLENLKPFKFFKDGKSCVLKVGHRVDFDFIDEEAYIQIIQDDDFLRDKGGETKFPFIDIEIFSKLHGIELEMLYCGDCYDDFRYRISSVEEKKSLSLFSRMKRKWWS